MKKEHMKRETYKIWRKGRSMWGREKKKKSAGKSWEKLEAVLSHYVTIITAGKLNMNEGRGHRTKQVMQKVNGMINEN